MALQVFQPGKATRANGTHVGPRFVGTDLERFLGNGLSRTGIGRPHGRRLSGGRRVGNHGGGTIGVGYGTNV